MRQLLLSLAIALLLTGCAGGRREEERLSSLQEELREAGSFSFEAAVTARSGGETFSYEARCRWERGETLAVLTAPETLRGLCFRSQAGAGTLEYDGLSVYLGPPATEEESEPCRLLSLFAEALVNGPILYTSRKGETLSAALSLRDGWTVTLWFTDGETFPYQAEAAFQGKTVGTLLLRAGEIKEETA